LVYGSSTLGGTNLHILPTTVGDDLQGQWWITSDVLDLDGDGAIDVVREWDDDGEFIYSTFEPEERAYLLLREIDNGAGATTAITYASSNDASVHIGASQPGMPHRLWVVDTMTTTSIHVGKWPGDPTTYPAVVSEAAYRYGSPMWNQDLDGRWGFRGFEAVETYGPPDSQGKRAKVVSTFDFTLDHSGRLIEVVTFEDSSSSAVDSVAQTLYEELHVLGDGDSVLEAGE